jgi:hypothetical protein
MYNQDNKRTYSIDYNVSLFTDRTITVSSNWPAQLVLHAANSLLVSSASLAPRETFPAAAAEEEGRLDEDPSWDDGSTRL